MFRPERCLLVISSWSTPTYPTYASWYSAPEPGRPAGKIGYVRREGEGEGEGERTGSEESPMDVLKCICVQPEQMLLVFSLVDWPSSSSSCRSRSLSLDAARRDDERGPRMRINNADTHCNDRQSPYREYRARYHQHNTIRHDTTRHDTLTYL